MDPPQRVVVGVDTSTESAAALGWALTVAGALGASVTVVHAVGLLEDAGYRPRPDLGAFVDDCRRTVSGPIPPTDEVCEDGSAADVVVRIAERLGADLIVVGRRGLGQASHLLGSVSEAVLERSPVAVVIVPAT